MGHLDAVLVDLLQPFRPVLLQDGRGFQFVLLLHFWRVAEQQLGIDVDIVVTSSHLLVCVHFAVVGLGVGLVLLDGVVCGLDGLLVLFEFEVAEADVGVGHLFVGRGVLIDVEFVALEGVFVVACFEILVSSILQRH